MDFLTKFARMFIRPRCDMPISISFTPWDGQASSSALRRIIAPSPPSLEKRFSPRKRLPRKFSNASASSTQHSELSFFAGVSSERSAWVSIRSRTQWRTVVLWMCMNSKPILFE